MEAIWSFDEDNGRLDPNTNGSLKMAMVKAVRDSIPQPHIKRILDLAGQGWKGLEFEVLDTDWQGEG